VGECALFFVLVIVSEDKGVVLVVAGVGIVFFVGGEGNFGRLVVGKVGNGLERWEEGRKPQFEWGRSATVAVW